MCETLKGIFELAASHGLPDDRRRAEYVLSKTDYSSAEVWDSRLGMVLWDALYGQAGDVEPNLLIMRLSEMHSDDFNTLMNEVLAMTRRGKTMLDEIVDDINEEVERSEFDDFMSSQSERYPVNDAYMEADEESYTEPDDQYVGEMQEDDGFGSLFWDAGEENRDSWIGIQEFI